MKSAQARRGMVRVFRRSLLGLPLLLASATAQAQPAEQPAPPAGLTAPRAMRLNEALRYAMAHQPQVVAAAARVAAARADARVPRAQWLPVLGAAAELVVGTTNNTTATPVNSGVLDVARIGGTTVVAPGDATLVPSASTYLGVGVGQEIFDFGRIAAQSAALDSLVLVQQYEGGLTELDVGYSVESAYYSVGAARSVVAAAEGAYARSLAHRDLAKAGVSSGLRPPIELTRAEADLKRFDVGRIRARGGLVAAQAQLAAAVGVPDPTLDAAESPNPDLSPLPPAGQLMREAGDRDPAILAARARLRAQRAETTAIRAELRPNLWLTGTFSGRGGSADASGATTNGTSNLPNDSWAPLVPNWDLGLVLSWRAFDDTVLARARASEARERVRQAELDSVQQKDIAVVQQAYTAALVAQNALPALVRSREAAQANYDQVEARFKAGLATGVELADAEAIRTDAEIQEALGRFEVARTRAALARAVGRGQMRR
ncbi:MAG TPA: TolC family protein [Minicystis sp.]|nr:TolC family protein [Minicystis sp.]